MTRPFDHVFDYVEEDTKVTIGEVTDLESEWL
jgi:hypothetical protein